MTAQRLKPAAGSSVQQEQSAAARRGTSRTGQPNNVAASKTVGIRRGCELPNYLVLAQVS